MPTASAIVGDLIDVVTGRAGPPARLIDGSLELKPPVPLAAPNQVQISLLSPVHHRRSAGRPRQASQDSR